MLSLGNHSKFVGTLSKSLSQVAIGTCETPFRGYADRAADADIKWQWSVRDKPCQECYKFKTRRWWIAKLFGRKTEGLTNKRNIVEYRPKIWELQYYDYLFPKCDDSFDKCESAGDEVQGKQKGNLECGGHGQSSVRKQNLTGSQPDEVKEPFCMNQVCGAKKPPKRNKDGEKEFMCFNYLINKEKSLKTNF